MTQTTTTPSPDDYGYAIVTARGEIVSLHAAAVPAGAGWGFDRELVALARPHRIGDRIEWDARGTECGPRRDR